MKKTYWIRRTHLFRSDEYECSSCRNCTDKPLKTCPFCGMSMRGLKHDPFDADEMEILDDIFEKTETWARVTYHRARLKIIERLGDTNEK